MKTCICDRTEIMWNTHREGVSTDNIVRYTVSSLTVLQHSLARLIPQRQCCKNVLGVMCLLHCYFNKFRFNWMAHCCKSGRVNSSTSFKKRVCLELVQTQLLRSVYDIEISLWRIVLQLVCVARLYDNQMEQLRNWHQVIKDVMKKGYFLRKMTSSD